MFDVGKKADDFEMDHLLRLSTRFADQIPVFRKLEEDPAHPVPPPFAPASEVKSVRPTDRVFVLPGVPDRAYPLPAVDPFVAAYDASGDRPLFLVWNPLRQAARCLVAQGGGAEIEWRDAGLVYRGAPVFYDKETGSLWDGFTGEAITGPKAGSSAEVVPVTVLTWDSWVAEHPDGEVFVAGLPTTGLPVGETLSDQALAQWLASPSLPPNSEPGDGDPLADKAYVLGVVAGGQARAYPLEALAAAQQEQVADTIGGAQVSVTVTSPMTGSATVDGAPAADAEVMLWYAWREVHPETTVYTVAAPEPPAAG
jgi:hypothetical protein